MADLIVNKAPEAEECDDLQFERLAYKRKEIADSLFHNKENATVQTRDIPLNMLAIEWFNKIDASIEMRAYLVENFLPILVLGCEKILKDAQKKNLVESNKEDVDFNPINLLGQYLMRNNPKYNNHNETSAYVRTMREVYQELREQMFAFQENKLAKVKADIRQRRADRETLQKSRQTEMNRRSEKLEDLFTKWHIASNGRIEIAVVMDSFKMYKDHIANMPEKTKKSAEINLNSLPSYCFSRDGVNLTKRIMKNEFVQCTIAVTENLSSEYFDLFIEFFTECSKYFVIRANRTRLGKILKRLFQLVDSTNTGLLTRHRVIRLLEEFTRTRASPEMKEHLKNPMSWPLLDPHLKFENKIKIEVNENDQEETETGQNDFTVVNDSIPVDTTTSNEESKGPETLEDVATKPEEEVKDEAKEVAVTEDEPETLDETEKTGDDSEAKNFVEKLEDNSHINARSEIGTKEDVDDEEMEEDYYVPVRTIISKDNELLFLNGGILYYRPLEDSLHAFDSGLITESKSPRAQSAMPKKPLEQLAFDADFLDSKQFLNLINIYLQSGALNLEANINELIVFLKDNYAESQKEKNDKLEKIAFEKKFYTQRERIEKCFEKLDNEGTCSLSVEFITGNLENFKEGMFKEQIHQATEKLKAKIQMNGREDEVIYKNEFIDFISELIRLVDFAKFEDQLMNYLNGLMMPTPKTKVRGETRKVWLRQLETVGDLTFGSFEPLYKQLFASIIKDTETHGNNKTVSAYVGILESIGSSVCLKYQASTPYDSNFILGKTLMRDQPNVTFNVIDEGRHVHISSISENSNVHYFNPEKKKKDGSLLVYPLKYSRNKMFGSLGIDTVQENSKENQVFNENEIAYFQGVANTFANSYANIVFKNRMANTIISAANWLCDRCTAIDSFNVHIVQKFSNETNSIESTVSFGAGNSESKIKLKPIIKYQFCEQGLEDKMNIVEEEIRSSIYECAMTSESTVDMFNSRVSHCFPVRNEKKKTVFVIEIVSKDLPDIMKKFVAEMEYLETIVYVLDMCQRELLEELFHGNSFDQYEFEKKFLDEKFEILFEKKYLKLVVDQLSKSLDKNLVELLPDGTESPETSKTKELFILVGDLLANPEFAKTQMINEQLIEQLRSYDTTINGFKFKETQSKFALSNKNAIKELHSLFVELGSKNDSICHLIDWVCLSFGMNQRIEKIKNKLAK